mgnify:CR=1 FL=1
MTAQPISPHRALTYFTRASTFASLVGAALLFVALSPIVRAQLNIDTRVATIIGAAGALVLLITAGVNVFVWASSQDNRPAKFGRPVAVIEEADVEKYQGRLLAKLQKLPANRLAGLYALDGGSAEQLAGVPDGDRAEFVYRHLLRTAGAGLKMRERLQSLVTLLEGTL